MILRGQRGIIRLLWAGIKYWSGWPRDAGADNMPQSGKISSHPLPRQDWDNLDASIIIGGHCWCHRAALLPPEGTSLVLFPISHASRQKCKAKKNIFWPFHWTRESWASSHKITLMHVINIWREVQIWWRDHKCSNNKVKCVYEALWVNKYTGGDRYWAKCHVLSVWWRHHLVPPGAPDTRDESVTVWHRDGARDIIVTQSPVTSEMQISLNPHLSWFPRLSDSMPRCRTLISRKITPTEQARAEIWRPTV